MFMTTHMQILEDCEFHVSFGSVLSEDGEHEGLYAVLLCRVVGGRTKVVTNNDINIVPGTILCISAEENFLHFVRQVLPKAH